MFEEPPFTEEQISSLRREGVNYSRSIQISKLLFICGLHRSGTTLVEDYVRSEFEVSFLRAKVSENEGQHIQDVYPPASKYGGPGKFAFAPEMTLTALAEPLAKLYRRRLIECWSSFVVGNATILSEKSPPNLTKIDWLRSVFPGSIFLIVVRDPRAVAGATRKWSRSSLEELILHWNVSHSIAVRSLRDDCHILSYERFCDDPDGELKRSGIVAELERRAKPLLRGDRFKELKNTNMQYFSEHRCQFYGTGSWEYFGYSI